MLVTVRPDHSVAREREGLYPLVTEAPVALVATGGSKAFRVALAR